MLLGCQTTNLCQRGTDSTRAMIKSMSTSPSPFWLQIRIGFSPYCTDKDPNACQQHIGVLHWIVELGHFDICGEVSMLAAFSIAPQEGHLQAVTDMFSYLLTHDHSQIVLDPSYINHRDEPISEWKGFYSEVQEELPDATIRKWSPHGLFC